MRSKLLPLFITLVFIFIFVIFYRGLNDSNIYRPKNTKQYEIPVFNTNEFYSGKNINSSKIFELDKYYLLNIWSSWCIPCRQEHSFLMRLKEEDKIYILGLNYKDKKKNAEKFLKELGNPYKNIFIDLDGIIAIDLGAYGVPESFLIYNNKIIKKHIGPIDEKFINEVKLLVE